MRARNEPSFEALFPTLPPHWSSHAPFVPRPFVPGRGLADCRARRGPSPSRRCSRSRPPPRLRSAAPCSVRTTPRSRARPSSRPTPPRGTRRGGQTDDRGRYTIPFLDPGTYTVRAQRIGFRPTERTGLRVSLGAGRDAGFPAREHGHAARRDRRDRHRPRSSKGRRPARAPGSSRSSCASCRHRIATSRTSSCSRPARATSAPRAPAAGSRSAAGARRRPTC